METDYKSAIADQNANWERELKTCNRPWREHTIKALRNGGDHYSDYIGFEAWMAETTERMKENELFGVWEDLGIYERIGLYTMLCDVADFATKAAK